MNEAPEPESTTSSEGWRLTPQGQLHDHLHYSTAGESHGPGMFAMIDGLPWASADVDFINTELEPRQGATDGEAGRRSRPTMRSSSPASDSVMRSVPPSSCASRTATVALTTSSERRRCTGRAPVMPTSPAA